MGEEHKPLQNPKETNPDHLFPQCCLLVLRTSEMQKRASGTPSGEGDGGHASAPAWRIPGTGGHGGLPSMGSQGVGHDWATSLSCTGEGNGNPLQCSCLENPMDGGAWWAAVYGVAQSQTRLKRLSSSSSRIPWSLYSCTPCTILCSTHICMTLRDITFGHLSILPYPLKWKLHTGRASDMFTLWHVLQVLKKRAVEWRCGAHLQAFMDRVFPAAWLPPDPSLVRSCSSSITHQRGTLWHHCHGSSSRICAPDTVHVPTVRTHGTRTVRSWGSSPGVSYNLGHWSLRVRHEAAGTVNLCSPGPHIRNTPSNPSLVSWRDHLDVPLL